nr:hypothetical protein [Enterococcus cecorum]
MDIKIKKINFEGNILKVIKATVTEMRGKGIIGYCVFILQIPP